LFGRGLKFATALVFPLQLFQPFGVWMLLQTLRVFEACAALMCLIHLPVALLRIGLDGKST